MLQCSWTSCSLSPSQRKTWVLEATSSLFWKLHTWKEASASLWILRPGIAKAFLMQWSSNSNTSAKTCPKTLPSTQKTGVWYWASYRLNWFLPGHISCLCLMGSWRSYVRISGQRLEYGFTYISKEWTNL
ncbi:Hypothetical_protein [Hexamita inflata]|uniref:Hypothetical_protein n=1 Tax=Hexamita inflata TaxID=28002 RepID=A0ABP1GKP3_9EUKA